MAITPKGMDLQFGFSLNRFQAKGNALVSTFQKEADEEVVEKCTHSYSSSCVHAAC